MSVIHHSSSLPTPAPSQRAIEIKDQVAQTTPFEASHLRLWSKMKTTCVVACYIYILLSTNWGNLVEGRPRRSRRATTDCSPYLFKELNVPLPEVFITVSSLTVSPPKEKLNTSSSPRVSSTITPLLDRELEIHWREWNPQIGDWVGLFSEEPKQFFGQKPLAQIEVMGAPDGYAGTGIRLERITLPSLPPLVPPDSTEATRDVCLGFWTAYVRRNTTLAVNCLKARPTWMWDKRAALGPLPLSGLMLPGTHNTGSYSVEPPRPGAVFSRFVMTQDEDVETQLKLGIRYLDLRIGYYQETKQRFWINHNYVRVRPLEEVLSAVLHFIRNTREVVILDFHRFPVGFRRRAERHIELANFLVSQLSDHLAPDWLDPTATLNDLWALNRTLVLTYADRQTAAEQDLFWKRLPQEWGNCQTLPALKDFLESAVKKRSKHQGLWAAMAQLTPSAMDILLRPQDGLREKSYLVNRDVTTWFKDLWWRDANVIALDYFRGTDIVDVCIQGNLKRRQCWDENYYGSSEENDDSLLFPTTTRVKLEPAIVTKEKSDFDSRTQQLQSSDFPKITIVLSENEFATFTNPINSTTTMHYPSTPKLPPPVRVAKNLSSNALTIEG